MPRTSRSRLLRLASSVDGFWKIFLLILILLLTFPYLCSSTLRNPRSTHCQENCVFYPAVHSPESNISKAFTLQPAASASSFRTDLPGRASQSSTPGCCTSASSPSIHSLPSPSSSSTFRVQPSSVLDFHLFFPSFSSHSLQKARGLRSRCVQTDLLHPFHKSIVAGIRSKWPSAALLLNFQNADPNISLLSKHRRCNTSWRIRFPLMHKHHASVRTDKEPAFNSHCGISSFHKSAFSLGGVTVQQYETNYSLVSTRLSQPGVRYPLVCSLLSCWLPTEPQRLHKHKSAAQDRTPASYRTKPQSLSKGSAANVAARSRTAEAAQGDNMTKENNGTTKRQNESKLGDPNPAPEQNSSARYLLPTDETTKKVTKGNPRASVCSENGSSVFSSLLLPRRRSPTSVASMFSSSLRHFRPDRNASSKDYAIINIPVEVALHPVIFETLCSLADTLERFERTLLITATTAATALGLAVALPRLVELQKTGVFHHSTAAAVGILLLPLCFAVTFTWLTTRRQKENKVNGSPHHKGNAA